MATTNKISYNAESAVTITLASLGSSSTWLAGQEATSIDNSSTLALDYLVSGKFRVGTTPTTATEIRLYCFSTVGTSNTWPDVFTGSNAAATVTSAGVGQGFLKRAATANVDSNTTGRDYPVGKVSVARLFGGVVPHKFSFFVTHNTGVALDSTAGNFFLVIEPIFTTNG